MTLFHHTAIFCGFGYRAVQYLKCHVLSILRTLSPDLLLIASLRFEVYSINDYDFQ